MHLAQGCRPDKKAHRSNFYYSFFFLPSSKRKAVLSVYQFCRHLDDIADESISFDNKFELLGQCREEINNCYLAKATRPFSVELMKTVKAFGIPREYLHSLIDGVEMDFYHNRYSTFEELYEYCYRVASCVGLICIHIFGYKNDGTRDYAINLGIALQLTNILRDLKEDAKRGRVYLPLEDLERFGYSERELIAGRYNDSFIELMRFQCGRARFYYDRALFSLAREDRNSLLTAEIMRNTYFHILRRIERRNYDVFNDTVRLSNQEKMFIAIRTWLSHLFNKRRS